MRRTRAAEAEQRRHVAEATRTAERTRIARELHDVVTHHVTAMVVQAEAARYLTAAPDRLDESLTAITDTGRRAITDLRHLLDLLNPDHSTEPRLPSVGELHTLVEQTRLAGQPVEFTEDGTPAQTTGSAEVTAYRVVQEALTNALKYAHGSRTTVHVRHGERETTVEVSTDGLGIAHRVPGRQRARPRRAARTGRGARRRVQRGPGQRRRLRRAGPHPRPGARRDRDAAGADLRRPAADPYGLRHDRRRPARPRGGWRVRGRARGGRARRPAAPGRRRDGRTDAACSTASRRPACWPAPGSPIR